MVEPQKWFRMAASGPAIYPRRYNGWPTTEDPMSGDIEDEICSHALVDRSNGSRVRVIRASGGLACRPPSGRCLRAG